MTYPNADTQSYTYDPMGNKLTKMNNSVTTNYTNDNADQVSICDEGKEKGIALIYGGPKTYAPGLHKDCKTVDIVTCPRKLVHSL